MELVWNDHCIHENLSSSWICAYYAINGQVTIANIMNRALQMLCEHYTNVVIWKVINFDNKHWKCNPNNKFLQYTSIFHSFEESVQQFYQFYCLLIRKIRACLACFLLFIKNVQTVRLLIHQTITRVSSPIQPTH